MAGLGFTQRLPAATYIDRSTGQAKSALQYSIRQQYQPAMYFAPLVRDASREEFLEPLPSLGV